MNGFHKELFYVPAQLQTSATTLFFLEQTGYTAPRVHLTKTGVPIATHAGWSALLLSFIHGVSPDYTPAGLRARGAALAGLYCVDTAGPDAATLPPSRWMLDTLLPQALAQLNAVAHSVPDALASLHRAWDDLYRRMTDWADLPLTLIHGDCWPANAVHTWNAAEGIIAITNNYLVQISS